MPGATPVTVPPATVAKPGTLLPHVPPPVASVNNIVVPGHTTDGPDIAGGTGLTVSTSVFVQPVDV